MEKITLDLKGIHDYQQNRFPYLLIDHASEVIPGKSAKGYRDLSKDDWWVEVHFPSDPNMPGALQIEAIVQLGALMVTTLPGNKGEIIYLVSANNLRFRKKVVPGNRLLLNTELISWRRGYGKAKGSAYIKDKMACSIEFEFVMPSISSNYSIKR